MQVWELEEDGRTHRVEVESGALTRRYRWSVDGVTVAERRSAEDHLTIDGESLGTVKVRYSTLGRPQRASLDGTDMIPEPGSRAERYEDRLRAHPRLYTLQQTLGAAGGVIVPIVLLALLGRLVLPSIPWPDWDLPSLDLPSLDLPGIPWPDLPDWSAPRWLEAIADSAKYWVPVLVAFLLARAEVRRRRTQDSRRQGSRED